MGRPRKHIDIFKKYTRLTATKEVEGTKYSRRILCVCDCGKEVVVPLNALLSGNTKSCGCLKKETTAKNSHKHGLSGHPLYRVWCSMKDRCLNKNCTGYHNYGGRGVSVCKAWMEFQSFYEWATTNGYKKGLTIERVDNDGNYCPENCTFIPLYEQSKNRRGLRLISFNGETKTISQWARDIGINRMSLKDRIENGWPISEALTTPPLKTGHHRI